MPQGYNCSCHKALRENKRRRTNKGIIVEVRKKIKEIEQKGEHIFYKNLNKKRELKFDRSTSKKRLKREIRMLTSTKT